MQDSKRKLINECIVTGDTLYILVGQEGESACVIDGVETREGLCSQMVSIKTKKNYKCFWMKYPILRNLSNIDAFLKYITHSVVKVSANVYNIKCSIFL